MRIPFQTKRHLSRPDEARLVAAIQAAERGHRGEIQVFLEARYAGDGPVSRARQLFEELGLSATRDGTAALLYVAIEDRRVAVWAGPGLYGAAEPGFWQDVSAQVAAGCKTGDLAGGIERALATIGQLLSVAAPGEDIHGNELPDRIHQR